MDQQILTRDTMKRGGRYNWRGQPERLIYLGRNWSGNGWWNQFKKIGDPREVWCEVVDSDLNMLEETDQPVATIGDTIAVDVRHPRPQTIALVLETSGAVAFANALLQDPLSGWRLVQAPGGAG